MATKWQTIEWHTAHPEWLAAHPRPTRLRDPRRHPEARWAVTLEEYDAAETAYAQWLAAWYDAASSLRHRGAR